MNRTSLKISAATLLPAVATLLAIQACGAGGNAEAQAQAAPDPIVGVWDASVTQQDCASGATLSSFRSSQVFHGDGTFADTSSHAPGSRGPGFGIWARGGDGYSVKFRFFRYNADGSVAGTSVSTLKASLADDGTLNATRATEVRDNAGNVVAMVCTTDAATRLR